MSLSQPSHAGTLILNSQPPGLRNILLLFRTYPVCSTLLQQPELRQETVVGAGRTVRGLLVWVLVRDDKGLGYCACGENGDPQRWKVDVRTNAEGREGKGKLNKFYKRKM